MAHLQLIKGGEVMGMGLADYVWLTDDGDINFKKKSVLIAKDKAGDPAPLADRWTFSHCPECDNECECEDAVTRILVPCFYLPDPTRPNPSYIVLCEVRDADDVCVESNWRAKLRAAMDERGSGANLVYFGFEQDYAHAEASGSEDSGFEARRFAAAERHIGAMFDAGLLFHSAWNSPGSEHWDFKVGVRGFPNDLDPDPPNALIVADHLIIARYLMEKICGSHGIVPLWEDLASFVSTDALRQPGSDFAAEADRLDEALTELGRTRRVPHPTRGGTSCIELTQESPDDFGHPDVNPYKLALEVLCAAWPLTFLELTMKPE
jgi:hypothetical protein